ARGRRRRRRRRDDRRRPRPRRDARTGRALRRRDGGRNASRRRLRRACADAAGGVVIKILLVDDQALVRSGFRMILESKDDLEVIGEAADGREAVELEQVTSPDVVLMDVRMPELDGVEATRRILGAGSAARVIILTTFDLDEYVFE